MTLYSSLLALHSINRWAIVALVVLLLVRSIRGWSAGRPWERTDERTHLALVASVDVQLLLGLVLYVHSSPIVRTFLDDPAHAMKVTELRFFGIEHPVTMLAALVVIHVGRVRSKSGPRHRRAFVWTSVAAILFLAGIPWPFLRQGRPLVRSPVTASAPAPSGSCSATYEERCVSCHGARGRGDGTAAMSLHPPPRNFADAAWQSSRDDAAIAGVVHDGGLAHGLSAAMPSQKDLSEKELNDLVRCIRSFDSQDREALGRSASPD